MGGIWRFKYDFCELQKVYSCPMLDAINRVKTLLMAVCQLSFVSFIKLGTSGMMSNIDLKNQYWINLEWS